MCKSRCREGNVSNFQVPIVGASIKWGSLVRRERSFTAVIPAITEE